MKKAKKEQALIFYGKNSDPRFVCRYSLIALEEAYKKRKPIEVYTINIDKVPLNNSDAEIYHWHNEVICCATLNEGLVMEKQVNPFEPTFRQMVRNIL